MEIEQVMPQNSRLRSNPQIRINNPQVVSKSYPGFWDDLKKVGFGVVES